MIADRLNKSELWDKFFNQDTGNRHTVHVHAKNRTSLQKHIIEEHIPSAWGTYSLVEIQNILLQHGYNDPKNYKFILLSESHIPVHSFDYVYKKLTENNCGYVGYGSDIVSNRFNTINNMLGWKREEWLVSSQWCILNREHVSIILANKKIMRNIFEHSAVPDETAYVNVLNHYCGMKNIINMNQTHVRFVPNTVGKLVPYIYTYLDQNTMTKIGKNHLFMRKISPDCIIRPFL